MHLKLTSHSVGQKLYSTKHLNISIVFCSTLDTPDMIMVLFFLGDFNFCFADSLNCRMAASATGSVPFSTSSSEKKALFQREERKIGKNRAKRGRLCS